jgi:hypothetical protein
VDRVADENTGRRLKIEKAVTEPSGGAAWFERHGRMCRDHQEQALLIHNRTKFRMLDNLNGDTS